MITLITYINCLIFLYFMALCLGFTVLLIASFPDIIRRFDEVKYGNIYELMNGDFSVPMTVIMPAYNLGHEILDAIYSILYSEYKGTNIVIVNDGSTDDTMKKLIEAFELYQTPLVIKEKIKTAKLLGYYESKKFPQLTVIDKEHSNTGDTLNAGINACRTPIFASVDADTLVERDGITRIMFSFIAKAHCISVGGAVYISNDNPMKDGKFIDEPRIPRHFVPAMQLCEYFRSFLFGRSGWNAFGGALGYAGAFTLFETQAAIQVGGYDTNNFAQDCEIVLKMHAFMRERKFPYAVDFTPTAFSWTEVPKTLFSFWKQRDHWQRGMLRSFCLHRNMFFNPKYGVIGMFTYPFYVFFEIMAPLIEMTSYILLGIGWYLHIISWKIALLFIALAMGYVGFLTVASIFLNFVTFNKYPRSFDVIKILVLSLMDMVVFRQYHTLCKVVATFRYIINRLRGQRL